MAPRERLLRLTQPGGLPAAATPLPFGEPGYYSRVLPDYVAEPYAGVPRAATLPASRWTHWRRDQPDEAQLVHLFLRQPVGSRYIRREGAQPQPVLVFAPNPLTRVRERPAGTYEAVPTEARIAGMVAELEIPGSVRRRR